MKVAKKRRKTQPASGAKNIAQVLIALLLNPNSVPLPLFAAGLSAMGFLGWRRRKAAVGE